MRGHKCLWTEGSCSSIRLAQQAIHPPRERGTLSAPSSCTLAAPPLSYIGRRVKVVQSAQHTHLLQEGSVTQAQFPACPGG